MGWDVEMNRQRRIETKNDCGRVKGKGTRNRSVQDM
jgi:hypothetical protein